ncbi:hypothetical protein FXO37_36507 [Capsicum annuum]|nr:hypothetical protein FXO37_36507 [Capsicum annuum]
MDAAIEKVEPVLTDFRYYQTVEGKDHNLHQLYLASKVLEMDEDPLTFKNHQAKDLLTASASSFLLIGRTNGSWCARNNREHLEVEVPWPKWTQSWGKDNNDSDFEDIGSGGNYPADEDFEEEQEEDALLITRKMQRMAIKEVMKMRRRRKTRRRKMHRHIYRFYIIA